MRVKRDSFKKNNKIGDFSTQTLLVSIFKEVYVQKF